MKIYTKSGDDGETGLFAGPRVWKDHPRIEACGSLDELNAALGLARSAGLPPGIEALLRRVQHELFALGAELAAPDPAAGATSLLDDTNVAALEAAIDDFEAGLPSLKEFILPGGTPAASHLHLARGLCRRAERRVVTLRLAESEGVAGHVIRYLNRLSDLLFVLARAANAAVNEKDVAWQKPPTAGRRGKAAD